MRRRLFCEGGSSSSSAEHEMMVGLSNRVGQSESALLNSGMYGEEVCMADSRIDFIYLSEPDMIRAGVNANSARTACPFR
jgi:hypothetical protein